MAKQKGFIKLKGSLGGLTFYESGGNSIVKTTGGIDKSRIYSDPNFKRTRENMSEFGASATVGKALRQGFSSIIKNIKDSTITGRITGIMKRINSLGSGLRGRREFEILDHGEVLEGFEFNSKVPLSTVFYPAYAAPTLDANRSIATWEVPDFNASNFLRPPEGATHFKLILVSTVLSNYTYIADLKRYEPVATDENKVNGIAYSNAFSIVGEVGADTTLTVDLSFSSMLPNTVGVIVATGILFYQQINTELYELSSTNAMRISVVG
ncbi:hypothetical protein BW723_14390 [Polaribacter reichenbachii]|uniref:Uncharacterized protein n=1 Tax=Polaribacter reichenbachii TaxID=996801 RepID=A0A1B8U458_9FLAO|nr:hypothetical protein [Polaribacter reichenbachii]APZ47399.1 hypothetical protein BW723_14390 [Polaribacter reichenbachii]AUC18038.1 hypothetical protein BTO17_04835 [Polaribacter reichenbachii]OBY66648.1 hypothetical protein LPB301_05460 [Polaribacter reichenbachii]